MLKLIAPANKKPATFQNLENSNSDSENVFPNTTSTPRKTKETTSKTTPVKCSNKIFAAKEQECAKCGEGTTTDKSWVGFGNC